MCLTSADGGGADAAPDAKRPKTDLAAEATQGGTAETAGAETAAAGAPSEGTAAKESAPPEAAAAEPAPAATNAAGAVGGEAAADGDAEMADAATPAPKGEARASEPVTLAFRTFASGEECYSYFHELLMRLTPNQDLNEVCWRRNVARCAAGVW